MLTRIDGFPNIPSEIIIDIFLRCLPDEPFHRPHPQIAPILLTHVCSSWREFASRLPELWTSISLLDKGYSELTVAQILALKERLLDQVVLWKRNSCGHPTAIALELHGVPEEVVEEEGGGLVDAMQFWNTLLEQAVLEHPERIQNLSLKFETSGIGSPIFALPSESFSDLKSLYLDGGWDDDVMLLESMSTEAFAKAPNLRRVAASSLKIRPGSPAITTSFPWAQLTHLLLLEAQPVSSFSFIVTSCPMLQSLSLSLDERFEPPLPPTHTTTMTHLKELSLILLGIKHLTFLSTTSFPRLVKCRFCNNINNPELRILEWYQSFPAHHNYFISQLHLLNSLTLGYQKIACDELLEILRQTPLLVELIIDSEVCRYPIFFEALTYQPDKGIESLLVPKLELFSLYIETINTRGLIALEFTNDSFFDMLTSRVTPLIYSQDGFVQVSIYVAPLKSVFLCVERTLRAHQPIDFDDLKYRAERFSELELGISLAVVFSNSSDKSNWLQEEFLFW